METNLAVEGGFARPVFDSQAVFRAVMDAMARPGTVMPMPVLARPPTPLSAGAAAVVLALCDHDTPVWLDPALCQRQVKDWIGFHAGAPFATVPAEAHFGLVGAPAELMALENFAQGSQEYPDRSATLILQVASLATGPSLKLEGPGIERASMLAPTPLPRHFVEQWKANNRRFPRGVDVVLCAPDALACLPRTTRVAAMEG